MELRDLIHAGEEKAGSVKALGDALGIHANSLSDAKKNRRGLPPAACVKLAQIIGVPEIDVIAASELATEKDEARRAVWLPFVSRSAPLAMLIACASVTTFVTWPGEARANTGFATDQSAGLHIMRNWLRRLRSAIGRLAAVPIAQLG